MTYRYSSGLWEDNPGLVQLLGLCPLLAVTTTFANGVGLGVATLLVLTASNVLVSAARHLLIREIRIPVYVLIIASLVTCVELLFEAFAPGLDRSLGIFIPLIVTNCAIVARAELFASRNGIAPILLDGLGMGAGFALLLAGLGAFRELAGQGTVFAGVGTLVGREAGPGIALLPGGWLLLLLPPGAFMSLALAIALKNLLDARRSKRLGTRPLRRPATRP